MATITGTSTLDEISAEYQANASYEEDSSESKCRAFITAARALVLRLPQTVTGYGGDAMLQMSPVLVEKQLELARMWLGSRAAGRVTHADFRSFRT